MSFFSSARAFFHILKEDVSAARIGTPLGWLIHMHYQGRLADQSETELPFKSCSLQVNNRQVNLILTADYEGAFKGVFLDNEYQCTERLGFVPRRILDLGANIGMGTLHLHTQFPDAEFICVEPDPRNIALLKRNLEANGVRASIVQAAAGATAGALQLRYGKNPTCSALETSPMHDLKECVTVKLMTVTEMLDDADWDKVDIVKIDIEGTEDELLSIHSKWLQRVGVLILEIHPNTTPEQIESYLKPFGFHLSRVGMGREPVYFADRSA